MQRGDRHGPHQDDALKRDIESELRANRASAGPAGRVAALQLGRAARPSARLAATRRYRRALMSARSDGRTAPLLGSHIAERLRERPLVPGEILGRVLPLAVFEVGRLHEDVRAVLAGAFAMGCRVCDAHHDRVRDLVCPRRATIASHVSDDHRGVWADPELGAMCLPDAHAFGESKRRGQPLDGCADIGVDQNGNHRCGGNRAVLSQ